MQNPLILVHTGVYKGEFLVIDSNVTILGAGKNCAHFLFLVLIQAFYQ